ncbi:MAG: zinc ABC transporter substrate-binding protein [Bacteroidales bacterium]|nr:zinc ABC transporter substrate-binding protein [Bacteroidales bacterium]
MKRIFIFLLFPLFVVGCKTESDDREVKVITVSIEPFGFFTGAIAGDIYKINVIVPPGASPATYEPPPAVIRGINNSDLIIINAYLGFEMAWIDRITGLNEELKILRLADTQELITADSHRHGDITHYTGVDPHFWVSPRRALIMAKDIKDFLLANDPDNAEKYNSNYLRLDSLIRETDAYLESLFGDPGGKSFMIYHPSLTYLAYDYGLEQITVETEGKEPSPSELKELIDEGRKKNIRAIFVQREFDRKNADIIGKEIGAGTVVIDPLSRDWQQSVKDIAESISGRQNN